MKRKKNSNSQVKTTLETVNGASASNTPELSLVSNTMSSTQPAISETIPPVNPPAPDESKRKKKFTYEHNFQLIRDGIRNSLNDPVFMQYVSPFGYNETKLNEGLALADSVEQQHIEQKNKISEKKIATRIKDGKRREVTKRLKRFFKAGELAFENDPITMEKLGIGSVKRSDFPGWLDRGKLFYTNALAMPEVIAEFSKYNVTQQDLELGLQDLLGVEALNTQRLSISAEAQQKTDLKGNGFYKLVDWWRGYLKIVGVALKPDPQLKERVGVVVP